MIMAKNDFTIFRYSGEDEQCGDSEHSRIRKARIR